MRNGHHRVEAWQFTIGIDLHSARRVSEERPADVQVVVLTAGAGWIRVEVVGGAPKAGSLLLVAGHGLFEVTRRDEWRLGDGSPRLYLMLQTVSGEQSTAPVERARRWVHP